MLNFGSVNLNSLMNKVDFLKALCTDGDLHVLGVAETWLLPDTPSSFVALPGYNIIRGDTDSNVRKHGACLYVANSVNHVEFGVPLGT